ncbi:MAG: hypothetical protein IK016_03795 [Lachnospiraceae bacterium]|nr:hypothetical protein [Lachnospiraceae bacterium]
MKKWKTIMAVFACILFGGVLAAWYLRESVTIQIVLILLHSLSLIVLAYLHSIHEEDGYAEELQQDLLEARRGFAEEKETLQKALDSSVKNLEQSTEENRVLKETQAKLEYKIGSLSGELERLKEEKTQEPDISEFLPPADEGESETIDIIAAAKEAAKELESAARHANVAVRVSSALQELLVRAEPSRIRILFRNVIDNAIKYMRRAGSLVITISNIDDDIFIVLKDTGEGLSEDETKHVFELNFQGSNRISGNGLGLTQTKAIVDYYGGTIYAKSMPGKGMGVYIQLPSTGRKNEEGA